MATKSTKIDLEEDLLDNLEKYQEEFIKIPKKNVEKQMPKSVKAFYERIEAFNKLHAPKVDESQTYVISGRGKGIMDRLVEPGKIVPYSETDDDEIRKKIREVSGVGYRNESIEQGFAQLTEHEQFADASCSSSNNSQFEFEIVDKSSSKSKTSKSSCSSSASACDEENFEKNFPLLNKTTKSKNGRLSA